MTIILLYDYLELEERASRHLNVWKAWHLVIYTFAAIFGILNYVFLQNTMVLIGNNCVLYPRQLEFRVVELPQSESQLYMETHRSVDINTTTNAQETVTEAQDTGNATNNKDEKSTKDVDNHNTTQDDNDAMDDENDVYVSENETHRLILDTSRTLFGQDNDCEFAEYMPILSLIFGAVWATMFIMCPGGGYSRSGLQQPWRILAPALLFAIVMVGLTGHSFVVTNGGIHAFCAAFYNVTNATTCSAAEHHINSSWEVQWGFGGRAMSTRAAAAGVWVTWALGAALLLARCLAAPDFRVRRTAAKLADPTQKIAPMLKKSKRVSHPSPAKSDNSSVLSEPTATTELVTAVVEPPDTPSTSPPFDKKSINEHIEMAITPSLKKV